MGDALQYISDVVGEVNKEIVGRLRSEHVTFAAVGIVLAAAVLQRFWILHGISLIIVGYIATIVAKWIFYILDDKDLWSALSYLNRWLAFFQRESKDILENRASWKMAFVEAYIAQASSTGVAVVRYIYDRKMVVLRKEFLRDLGGDRGSRTREDQ